MVQQEVLHSYQGQNLIEFFILDNSGYDNQGGHFNSESFEHYSSGGNIKEHDLTDLFDIALTALAFLSFGMFIIHVIMCISLAVSPLCLICIIYLHKTFLLIINR